ncbi:MAG: XRE family transcriptional regulator [Armatimonadetes bacterium]|nr:MAG: XRE family transcriptional regulator [Armatimonadota bacterium]
MDRLAGDPEMSGDLGRRVLVSSHRCDDLAGGADLILRLHGRQSTGCQVILSTTIILDTMSGFVQCLSSDVDYKEGIMQTFRPTSALGHLLENEVEQRGITHGEAAKMMGISRNAYNNWRLGSIPKIEHVPAISAFCSVPVRVVLSAVGIDTSRVYDLSDIPGYHHWRGDNDVPDLVLVPAA